jgi:hypothetical protein
MKAGLLTSILKTAIPVVAGVALATVADKTIVPKVSALEPTGLTFEPKRLLTIVAVFTAAALAVHMIGRKMNINLLK